MEFKEKIQEKMNNEKKHKESNITKKMRENPWIASTFVLGVFCLIFLIANFIPEEINSEINQNICSQISATPSWIKDNQLIGRGFTNFNNSDPNIITEQLINDNVYLVYSSACSACAMQINYFGNSWNKYKDSGLAIEC